MSDRPMLLKYLTTKMKIILCIFLLCITVSVFGQSQELNGIVGESIEFPAAVETGRSLMYGLKVIGRVLGGELLPLTTPEYQGRVQWDKSTGLFSLSRLRLEDSGVYTVESDGLKSVSTFSLTVWIPVSKPHVRVTRDEYPCKLMCTVERGTEVTLSWYREGEKESYSSSPVQSAPHLYLPETVESGTYTCEVKNSVSRETSDPLTVEAHCTAPAGPSPGTIVGIIIAVVAVLIAVVFALLYRRIKRKILVMRSKQPAKKLQDNVDPPASRDAVQPLAQSGNNSKHPTKDDQGNIERKPSSSDSHYYESSDAFAHYYESSDAFGIRRKLNDE